MVIGLPGDIPYPNPLYPNSSASVWCWERVELQALILKCCRAMPGGSQLGRWISSLFSIFHIMGDRAKPHPQPPFPFFPPYEGEQVERWLGLLQIIHPTEFEQCLIVSADYCKATEGKGHEYLSFRVQHAKAETFFYVVADRRWIPAAGADSPTSPPTPTPLRRSSSSASSTNLVRLSSPSIHTTPAHDTIHSSVSPPPEAEIVDYIQFSDPSAPLSLLSLAFILDAAHRADDRYNIYKSNCYWYAKVVWDSLTRVFRATTSTPIPPTKSQGKQGTYCGCTVVGQGDVDAGVATTIENYDSAYRIYLEKRDAPLDQARAEAECFKAQLEQVSKEKAELERKLLARHHPNNSDV
ncbi:hypothetical protein JAAARDRAFT_32826 [Jaapia argillacea MUCL 33604]|uniref:Uncharacterized protein n=1 Tax=Jaapia argillacea MUCL 33604 TaxID=933084 RepID=A0A067QCY2_9AGAM|nr:hypothetical protein JAAARDRAFT_32826 [Jaapia argillacea MUCL 33604]